MTVVCQKQVSIRNINVSHFPLQNKGLPYGLLVEGVEVWSIFSICNLRRRENIVQSQLMIHESVRRMSV